MSHVNKVLKNQVDTIKLLTETLQNTIKEKEFRENESEALSKEVNN